MKIKKNAIDCEIDAVLEKLKEVDPTDQEYSKLCDVLSRLHDLKRQSKKRSVSPDTMALIAANLGGIILVLAWEEKHVIATKAFGMISKLRL